MDGGKGPKVTDRQRAAEKGSSQQRIWGSTCEVLGLTQRPKVSNSECPIILKRVGTLGFARLEISNKVLSALLSKVKLVSLCRRFRMRPDLLEVFIASN